MSSEQVESEVESSSFRDMLDRLGQQTDEMIANFLAQEPKAIDLVGQVGLLPGKVLDVLVAMKDQLNDESYAALDSWEQETNERNLELFEKYEAQSPLHQVMQALQAQQEALQGPIRLLVEQQEALLRPAREWQGHLSSLNRHMWEYQESPLVREMREWQEREAQRHREMWETLERSQRRFRESLPPNWKSPEIEFPGFEELAVLQLQEGLPLAWVPPNHVLSQILARKSNASRRRVISHESQTILTACFPELRRLKSGETKEWRSSAKQAALAMKAGHWRAGQALAAIALDTATVKFVKSSYKDAVKQSRDGKGNVKVATPPGSLEHSLPTWRDVDYPRALLVLHSLYGAFGEFDQHGGEPVPTQFTRHGTVHTVSRRQYSKANSLIALMHIVGLLCLIEDK